MIPGDFQVKKPTFKKLLKLSVMGGVSLGVLLVGLIAVTWVLSAWFGRPIIFANNEGPDQPIAFPHETHVDGIGLECAFCHRNVTTEAAATIPSAGLCVTCHQVVGDDLPEVEKVRSMVADNRPIDWVRVHRNPDHVHFVHEAHIRRFAGTKEVVKELTNSETQIRLEDAQRIDAEFEMGQSVEISESQVCSICHGDVTESEKVRQVRSLKMGDCVDCHRANDAPTDCSTCHY